MTDFNVLVGKTLIAADIASGNDDALFMTDVDQGYHILHHQQGAEYVVIEHVDGDVDNLIGHPITTATMHTVAAGEPEEATMPIPPGPHLWTLFEVATAAGTVTIRWLGQGSDPAALGVSFEVLAAS